MTFRTHTELFNWESIADDLCCPVYLAKPKMHRNDSPCPQKAYNLVDMASTNYSVKQLPQWEFLKERRRQVDPFEMSLKG